MFLLIKNSDLFYQFSKFSSKLNKLFHVFWDLTCYLHLITLITSSSSFPHLYYKTSLHYIFLWKIKWQISKYLNNNLTLIKYFGVKFCILHSKWKIYYVIELNKLHNMILYTKRRNDNSVSFLNYPINRFINCMKYIK